MTTYSKLSVSEAIDKRFCAALIAALVVGIAGWGLISGQIFDEPIIADVSPQGEVSPNNITLSFNTQDLATCRYSSSDVSYDSMDGVMNSDGLSHSADLGTLAAGQHTYYARCKDYANKANSSSIAIRFTVSGSSSGGDTQPPIISNLDPRGTLDDPYVTISVKTNESARCRYGTADEDYEEMSQTLSTSGGMDHIRTLGTLAAGSHTYYVRCKDDAGNKNYSSALIQFTVSGTPANPDNPYNPPDNPPANADTVPPVVSGMQPSGTIYEKIVILSVATNEYAECRYSWYDRDYNAMTLNFTSANGLYHTASKSSWGGGNYTWYVRCKDNAGNVSSPAGKIIYYYSAPVANNPVVTTPADTVPPAISGLEPSGELSTSTVTLSCATDEPATCKFDTSDKAYGQMASTFDAAGGNTFSKSIALPAPGPYEYFVRCKDKSGNINTASGQINFTYAESTGPVISNAKPSGATIYQSKIALMVETDRPSDCRFSTADIDYDAMPDAFASNDGLVHQKTVDLTNYGPYAYYVRCEDKSGAKNPLSAQISFDYQNPDGGSVDYPNGQGGNATTSGTDVVPVVACGEDVSTDPSDAACDPTEDCVCDPDCGKDDYPVDPDCDKVKPAGSASGLFVVLLIVGLLVVAVIVVIFLMRRRGEDDTIETLP